MMGDRTMAELVPMRPLRVAWEDDPTATCEWCGKVTYETWVIQADPIPEHFCSADCLVQDTGMCWSPSKEIEEEWSKR